MIGQLIEGRTYSEIFVSVTGAVVLLVHDLLDHVLLLVTVDFAESLEQLGTRSLPQALTLAYQNQISRISHKTSKSLTYLQMPSFSESVRHTLVVRANKK